MEQTSNLINKGDRDEEEKFSWLGKGLSASRKPREKYGVGGPLGNIKYKFGDNEFPDKIFL